MKELFIQELPTEYDDEQNVLAVCDNVDKDGIKPVFLLITEEDTNNEVCIGLSRGQTLQVIQKLTKILQKYEK